MTTTTSTGIFTYAKVRVARPATALANHVKIQQHVAVVMQGPDARSHICLAAINKADMARLFVDIPKEFYVIFNGILSYVALKDNHDENSVFASIIALNLETLEQIFNYPPKEDGSYADFILDTTVENLPWLGLTVLASTEELNANVIGTRLAQIPKEEFETLRPMLKFNMATRTWVENNDPIEVPVERRTIHLKDIPLTNRANRRLVRNSLKEANSQLTKLWEAFNTDKSAQEQLSWRDWLVQAQAVNIYVLEELEAVDALPDDQYVEAMVTFKKAEVQAYHKTAITKGETDEHLFDWTVKNFGVEFNEVGRKEALEDIEGVNIESTPTDDSTEEYPYASFVITFDGTVVEDHAPAIGPESPFAIATMKTLKKNGHFIFIQTHREGDDLVAMLDFLKQNDFVPHGHCDGIPSGETLTRANSSLLEDNEALNLDLGVGIDYVIDHKQFGIATVQISNKTQCSPTLYWGDLVNTLNQYEYLSESDVDDILNSLEVEQ